MKRCTAGSLATALTVVSALTLSACSGSAKEGQVAAGKKQTLTMWAMGEEGKRLQDVADTFHKAHPNITVKISPVGWDVAHQKLVAGAAADDLPDMAQMGSTWMGEFIALDALTPVDTKKFHKNDFFSASWENNVKDGQVYGVPWYVDTRVTYYRTDLAKKAGFNNSPATWAERHELAKAYHDKAGTRWGAALETNDGAWQNWLDFLYSAGGDVLDKKGRLALDSPASVRALTEYGKYFKEGLAKKSTPPGYDIVKDFKSGRVPMFDSGPYMVQNINDGAPQLKGKWATARVPSDKSSTSFIGGASLVTFKGSAHKAAATEFTKYLSSAKQQAAWYGKVKSLPANQAAWSESPVKNADLSVLRQTLENAREVPPLSKWQEIAEKINGAIRDVAQEGKDPRQAAADLQKAAEGLVD